MVANHYINLSTAPEQMRQHILEIQNLAALQERQRIARDIHDSLGNALTTLNIQLQTAHKLLSLDPTLAEQFLAQAKRQGAIAIQQVRQSVKNIREIGSQEQSLTEMIDSLVQNFHQATGILPSTSINLSASLSTEIVTTLYRIIQESLTNICKYAEATQVEIVLNHTHSILRLLIIDNGKGFSLSQKKTGFGLQGMQERVAALKGDLNIDTQPGAGCLIAVYLPLVEQIVEEQASSGENFSLKIVDTTPVATTSTKDFSVAVVNVNTVNTTLVVETLTKDFTVAVVEPTLVAATSSHITPEESQSQFYLSGENYNQLENILVKFIGLLACKLLQQVIAQVSNCQELIDKLKLHLASNQHLELEKQTKFLFDQSTAKTETNFDNLAINDQFLLQCQEKLAELIGPMANYLIQKILQSSPNISRAELIKKIAWEITEDNKLVHNLKYEEVIDKLSLPIAADEKIAFNPESNLLLNQSHHHPENLILNLFNSNSSGITEKFLRQCEQNLVDLVGPMGVFLVQKAAKSSPEISRRELVKILAAEIADVHKASQFEQRLLTESL